jgi:hypothetical protein
LGWAARAGHGTTTGRDTPLVLADRYTCLWRDYSRVPLTNGRTSQFRYLLLITDVAEHTDSAQTHAALPRQHSLHAKAAAAPPAAPTTRPPASSAREEILAAARTLAGRSSDGSFTLMQIITSLRRAGSRYAESTIRTHVTSRMCADAPDHHGTTYDDFERLGGGRYRFRPSAS